MAEQSPGPAAGSAVDDDELDALVTALLTASRALVGISAGSLAGVEEAVTLAQFRTLVVLHAHGATALNRLAQRLQVNASTALRSVDRLLAAGLVDRRENAEDRREVVLELTPSGKRLVGDVTSRRRDAIEHVVRSMPPARRKGLVEALLAFAEAADEPIVVSESATALGW